MTEHPATPHSTPTRSPGARPGWAARSATLLRRVTSLSFLAGAFAVVVVCAIGPLTPVDSELHRHWASHFTPNWVTFLQDVPDRFASQTVSLPVLLVVAGLLARQRRSWRPMLVAAGAELGFYAVGVLKLVFARPSPGFGQPDFFSGGLLRMGREGISFPSGHSAEALLMYGAVVYLMATYSDASAARVRLLSALVGIGVITTVTTSYYLGYHWITDLAGGVLVGAFLLRCLVLADQHADGWLARRRLRGGDRAGGATLV